MVASIEPNVLPAVRARTSDHNIIIAAKGGSIVFAGSMFEYGMRLLMGIALARFLGAEHYGLYRLATTAGEMAAGIAVLGMGYAMVRFVSLYASQRDTARLWGALQVGTGVTALCGLLIGASLYALAGPIAERFFHDSRLVPLLQLASLIVPLLSAVSVLASATRGFKRMQYTVIAQQITQPLIRLALIALLAIAIGLSAAGAVAAYILGLVAACVLLLSSLNRMFPLRRPVRSAQRDVRGMLRFSLPIYISDLIDTFGGNLQTVLLGSMNTVATAGIFAVATQVSTISGMFNRSIGMAASPIVSELHGFGDRQQMKRFYQTTATWMFSLNLPISLALMLFPQAVLGVFGKDFVEGASALTILIWASLVTSSEGISDGVLNMTGNTLLRLVNSAVLSALTLGLSLWLIPSWGAMGAAIAAFAAAAGFGTLRVVEVFVLFRMLPYNTGFLKPVAAGLAAYAFGRITSQMFHTNLYLVAAAVNASAVLVVYAGAIWVLGLSAEDRAVLLALKRRIDDVLHARVRRDER